MLIRTVTEFCWQVFYYGTFAALVFQFVCFLDTGSLDGITDDSDDLFDETEALLKSVASELRTYESFNDDIDDDDEFFIYNKSEPVRGSQGLLSQFTTVSSLDISQPFAHQNVT